MEIMRRALRNFKAPTGTENSEKPSAPSIRLIVLRTRTDLIDIYDTSLGSIIVRKI